MGSAQRSIFSHKLISFCLVGFVMTFATPVVGETNASPLELQRLKGDSPQLPAVAEKTMTVEERVDSIFGVIVQHMVTVLFWDVVFWDNDDPMTASEPMGDKTQLTLMDPLGWGIVTLGEGSGSYIAKGGEKQGDYNFEGIPLAGAFTADGQQILVGTDRGELLVLSRAGGGPTQLGRLDGAITQVVATPDGKGFIVAGVSGQISVADLSAKSLTPLHQHKGAVSSIAFRSDGKYMISGSKDGRSVLFAIDESGAFKAEQTIVYSAPILHAAFAGDGESSVLTVSADGSVVVQGQDAITGLEGPLDRVWVSTNGAAVTVVAQGQKGAQVLQLKPEAKTHLLEGTSLAAVHFTGLDGFYGLDSTGNLSVYANQGGTWAKGESVAQAAGSSMASTAVTQGPKGTLYLQAGGSVTGFAYKTISLPFVVFWLALGAIFFTVRMGFVNFRMFGHAIQVVRGTYDNPDDEGEVTHFQALTSALSATVGLGNIAGVAIAVSIGGPGATFWMIMTGLLGMASKFAECTLGQKYRTVDANGAVMGGAMHYLSKGLGEMNMPRLGKGLAVLFSILCVGASFGGGNSFQVKQSLGVLSETFPVFADYNWAYGLIMMVLVGIVILGGIKRIAQTAEKVVPAMCGLYVAACLYVILVNVGSVGAAFGEIFGGAFAPDALYGGLVGVLVVGVTRAAFSNEAGIGSAAIAHAAAKTEYPVREGVVALLEPFIDTVVVCTMTALVIVITGAYENPDYGTVIAAKEGAQLTSLAMAEEISWFPYVLSVAVVLFAYSTMISWSYYGERCWTWLFGPKSTLYYRLLFLVFVFLGSIMTASNILDFSDLMILGMAIPNVLGVMLLSGQVRSDLDEYTGKLARGEMKRYK